jgi:hypothetical protein
MKTHRPLLQLTVTTTLLVALAIVSTRRFKAQAQRGGDLQSAAFAKQQAGYGKTTGLFGIAQGQTARLAVWNKGDEAVLTRLQFVDEQGKVLVLCDAIIQPGKAAVGSWPCCGGNANRVELQAQFGTNEKRSIGLLVPTLQVIDNATVANSWMIGLDGFVEFPLV